MKHIDTVGSKLVVAWLGAWTVFGAGCKPPAEEGVSAAKGTSDQSSADIVNQQRKIRDCRDFGTNPNVMYSAASRAYIAAKADDPDRRTMLGCIETALGAHADPNLRRAERPEFSVLGDAVRTGDLDLLNLVLTAKDVDVNLQSHQTDKAPINAFGNTVVVAAENGWAQVLRALIERNADVNGTDLLTKSDGLMRVIEVWQLQDNMSQERWGSRNYPETIALLLRSKIDLTRQNLAGETALDMLLRKYTYGNFAFQPTLGRDLDSAGNIAAHRTFLQAAIAKGLDVQQLAANLRVLNQAYGGRDGYGPFTGLMNSLMSTFHN